ncbi:MULTISPECIES: hypothetical protein [Sphingobacterium]|uniref:hypothetical protein n=1 Tax=Sphingobacterium TaxID=28453 RepID=UPI0013DBB9FC|nr:MULTISPECIES: hypothetical protein [unclassified Sphingobacterium]
MYKIITRFFHKEKSIDTTHLAAEARLSFEYSRADRKLLSVSLQQSTESPTELNLFMQEALSCADRGRISLDEECLLLEKYVKLFETYVGSEILVSFDFPVKPNDLLIPIFLLLPLVQNAFHYGYHAAKKYPVRIKGKIIADTLVLEVSNRVNHNITDQSQTELIQFFRSRLDYEYPNQYDLILNSNSHTFKATLRLKLECVKT